MSGQVAIDPATSAPVEGGVEQQARRMMDNIGIVLDGIGLGFGDVVKTTIFRKDIGHFPAVNAAYAAYFEDEPPARSTFQAGALPGGYTVEIEVIAAP